MTKPRRCARCGVNPVAYVGRTHCYECVPRVWKRPPSCKRCGSTENYFTNGLCRRCHRSALRIGSCRDCLAWGVTRHRDWLCQACKSWHNRFDAPQVCPSCKRIVLVNARGYCRLCCRQANMVRPRHSSIDVRVANKNGQQLFIADLFRQKRPDPPPSAPRTTAGLRRYPFAHRQLALFDAEHDFSAPRGRDLTPPLADLADALDQLTAEHASHYGWARTTEAMARCVIHLALAVQDTPGAPVKATDVAAVATGRSWRNTKSVLEILAAAGMLEDDREPALDTYFARQTAGLATPMADEISQWFRALRDGSSTRPRCRPRHPETVRDHIVNITPALRVWSAAGIQSLREIERSDVSNVLALEPAKGRKTLTSLRSLFRFLKARRMVFVNPTAHLHGAQETRNQPLPIALTPLREALHSAKPVRAALATLITFHALSVHEIRALKLIDLRDNRIHIDGRTILLADPVRATMADWLTERSRRWPNTINPHLFINQHTAVRDCPASRPWITTTLGISAQAIRQDRILHEAIATAGDLRRLSDLSISGAERYAHTTNQPIDSPTQARF